MTDSCTTLDQLVTAYDIEPTAERLAEIEQKLAEMEKEYENGKRNAQCHT